MTNWLAYGAGVNSTALLVLLAEGVRFPDIKTWRCVWADTKDEQDETYRYLWEVVCPFLRRLGKTLEVVCDDEGVLQRWERLKVTGSRTLRTCTDVAKIRPMDRHVKAHGSPGDLRLIGIDAGEQHRARPAMPTDLFQKRYPLVEADIDREECVAIIRRAGLPIPPKSGCWHCPFMRVKEILTLAVERPDRFQRIVNLELVSTATHPPAEGRVRAQWGEKPAKEWARRACAEKSSGPLFQEIDPDPPCGCYDG